MFIFCFDPYQDLAKPFLKSDNILAKFSVNRFPNHELFIRIEADVQNKECLIIGSITPPDENLFATLLLSHTLKKEGAKKVIFFAPHLAYTRADKYKPGESIATKLIAKLIKSAGIDKLVTIDIHSQLAAKFFSIPVTSISSAPVLAQEVKQIARPKTTLFAPDEGSLQRYQKIKKITKMSHPISYLKKVRNQAGVVHQDIIGQVTPSVIVIDDMLDTGGTLISCCQILKEKGAKEIIIMVTHGLFTGEKWKKLFDLGVKKIYCTNTVPLDQKVSDTRIITLPITPIILKIL